ncbi:acyltransferase family protein [Mucilaginibacter sp.]
MNKSTSLYLDFLRVIAAFGVLLVHASLPWFSNSLFLPLNLGHRLVMIFFVLSGYLIAYTVDKKNKGSQIYLIDRFSRLYSVVLPALIFTYIIDLAGKSIDPGFYLSQITPNHQAARFLLNATFLSQIWGLCSKPSSNGPFWSIPYEFWYYMIFWALYYLKGKWKYIIFIGICMFIGIKILLLFPVWLFGVMAYRITKHLTISNKKAQLLFGITFIIVLLLTFRFDFSFFSDIYKYGEPPLFFSSNFIFDWLYGLLVAINIFSAGYIVLSIKMPLIIEKTIKYFSSITFSLYLYHLPILVFIGAVLKYNKSSYIQVILILVVVVAIVSFLSEITEKHRGNFKALIKNIFLFFTKKKEIVNTKC